VLAAIRTLNRLEYVGETLRAALNSLATLAPEWLREHLAPAWFDRYGIVNLRKFVDEFFLLHPFGEERKRKVKLKRWAESPLLSDFSVEKRYN